MGTSPALVPYFKGLAGIFENRMHHEFQLWRITTVQLQAGYAARYIKGGLFVGGGGGQFSETVDSSDNLIGLRMFKQAG